MLGSTQGPTQQQHSFARRPSSCRHAKKLQLHAEDNSVVSERRVAQQRHIKPSALSVLSQAPVLQAPTQVSGTRIANFRFWHDEKRFRGTGDVSLAQHMLFAAGGTRTGGQFKDAVAQGSMGWQQPHKWDLLWSTSDGNLKAAHRAKPGQLLSGLPGMDCLSKKRHLAVTLQAAYGELAWQMLPRTYSIPAQLLAWRQRLADDAAAAESALSPTGSESPAGPGLEGVHSAVEGCIIGGHNSGDAPASSGYWVLKTGAHLGQGLKIVPANKALSTLLERNKPYLSPPGKQPLADSSSSNDTKHLPADTPRAFICAQQYMTDPLLINERKFGLRLWLLVIGPAPFRAYLYGNGLVLFSGQKYNADMQQVETGGAELQGHLTNHAQNQSADVWALQKLFDLLGPEPSEQLWEQLTRTAGRVVAAAADHVRAAAQELNLPQECAFELLGLDFLLDGSCKPWLLEVNASPSMAWQHTDKHTASLMKQMKQALLSDLMCLLRLQDRYPAASLHQQQHQQEQPVCQAATQQQQQQQREQPMCSSQDSLNSRRLGTALPCQEAGSTTRKSWNTSRRLQSKLDIKSVDIMLQAQSAKHFRDRPQTQQLVQEAAQLLHAAVALSPCQQQAQQQVQHLLDTLQQKSPSEQVPSEVKSSSRSHTELVTGCTSSQQDVLQLLHDHADKLAQLEGEFQSCGQWQSLLDSMPDVLTADRKQSDIDIAMRVYWQLRKG